MKSLPSPYILVGDEIFPHHEAKVSASDRGFLYGDGIYETLRIYQGIPFEMEEHLGRLRESAEALYMVLPWSDEELARKIQRTLEANETQEGRLRITVTRGEGDVRARPEDLRNPVIVIRAQPYEPPAEDFYLRGVSVEISERIRNLPDALDPAIKSGNLLNNLLARFEMRNEGTFETLLPNARGELTEGSLSNLFLVDGKGRLVTPSADSGILLGITRKWVIDLARTSGLEVLEKAVLAEELYEAQEAFITASTLEILPVTRVEDKPIGNGVAGSVTLALLETYRQGVRDYIESFDWPETHA
ncbi:aminotransferase class IV [bacterium]|nr:aminotransferase class IV [bacterium]